MGLPVVTVASGGLPIVESTVGGTPVTEATNGRGVAVTKVVGKPGLPVVFETIGAGTASPSAAFLARTSGLDATHTNAYTALIDGLVADSVWSKFDVLYIYATQDSATALLNLISSSYNGVANGSPTFTANRGFTGVDGSATVYINSGFNPTTASSPKYSLNSAHFSTWMVNTTASTTPMLGAQETGTTCAFMWKYSVDANFYLAISDTIVSFGNRAINQHIIGNRYDASNVELYETGVKPGISRSSPVGARPNKNFYTIGFNNNGPASGYGNQCMMVSWGSALTATDALNFYTRLRTYMTAVGVP